MAIDKNYWISCCRTTKRGRSDRENGLLRQLTKALMERALEAEMARIWAMKRATDREAGRQPPQRKKQKDHEG